LSDTITKPGTFVAEQLVSVMLSMWNDMLLFAASKSAACKLIAAPSIEEKEMLLP
jgi:hypothetical protein